MKTISLPISLALLGSILLSGCNNPGSTSGRNLALAPGDPEAGRDAFEEIGCARCHRVAGVELAEFDLPSGGGLQLELGGDTYRVKTYGELITSIANPEHIVQPKYRAEMERLGLEKGETVMPDLTDYMTVRQLIDILAFLDERYEFQYPHEYTPFYAH